MWGIGVHITWLLFAWGGIRQRAAHCAPELMELDAALATDSSPSTAAGHGAAMARTMDVTCRV